ncbi:hypothetical protein OC834_006664 [Tilletia horrida]|nr:hypothetical protein OC834_006664 [Tilletia horrida]
MDTPDIDYEQAPHELLVPPDTSDGYLGAKWWQRLTVTQLRDMKLPLVSPLEGNRLNWSKKHVPFSSITSDDTIPPEAQVQRLFLQSPAQLRAGFRSISMTMGNQRYHYSLSKIAFMRAVHPYLGLMRRFDDAYRMLEECRAAHCLSGPQFRQAVELPALSALTASSVTFCDLGTLAAEEWVVDRVIDHVLARAQAGFPLWWLPDTTFFQWLAVEDDFARERVIRNRDQHLRQVGVSSTQVPLLAGVLNPTSAHWTAVAVDLKNGTVYYGHSGSGSTLPPTQLLDSLNKYFAGSSVPHLDLTHCLELPVPKQVEAYGSCGLAAAMSLVRFVSSWFASTTVAPTWRDDGSRRHRRDWFSQIIIDALEEASRSTQPFAHEQVQETVEPAAEATDPERWLEQMFDFSGWEQGSATAATGSSSNFSAILGLTPSSPRPAAVPAPPPGTEEYKTTVAVVTRLGSGAAHIGFRAWP